MLKSEKVCIAKIDFVDGKHCNVELIFDGALEVLKEEIELEVEAHSEAVMVYDDDIGAMVETSHQVGDAGYGPFVSKLKQMYPSVQLIDSKTFNTIVAMREECAASLGL